MLHKKIIQEIIGVEGKYSNNPSDSGGETMYGITKAVAVKHDYTGDMRDMPYDVAVDIYKKQYWDKMHLDQVAALSLSIAHELMDTGVNQGIGRAAEYLQTSLNALNRQGKDYPDLKLDGDIGAATLAALTKYLKLRSASGELVLLRALNCLQGAFYVNLSQRRVKDEDFVFGWLLNRVNI